MNCSWLHNSFVNLTPVGIRLGGQMIPMDSKNCKCIKGKHNFYTHQDILESGQFEVLSFVLQ